MKLEHIAVWTHQLESLKEFYVQYFGAVANEKYSSQRAAGLYESYFLSFGGDARLELMKRPDIPQGDNLNGFESTGLTHLAFSMENPEDLDALFLRMKEDGVPVVYEPHTTGDGFYEAGMLDPDGNRVEIAVTP